MTVEGTSPSEASRILSPMHAYNLDLGCPDNLENAF